MSTSKLREEAELKEVTNVIINIPAEVSFALSELILDINAQSCINSNK